MTFEEYQKKSRETAIYQNLGNNFIYPTLGLAGETGEVVEKIKRVLREKNSIVDEQSKIEISKELGDALWYMAQLATELNLSLGNVALENLDKLHSRKERGALHGDGDNR